MNKSIEAHILRLKRSRGLVHEYRCMGDTDDWGSAMQAWFAVAHELFARGADIPAAWQFQPGCTTTPDNARDDDNYWFEVFIGVPDNELVAFGNLLERYTRLLKRAGKDY